MDFQSASTEMDQENMHVRTTLVGETPFRVVGGIEVCQPQLCGGHCLLR